MTHRTDPTEWTVPRLQSNILSLAEDLRRAADKIERIAEFRGKSDTPYIQAARECQQEFRSLLGNINIASIYDSAFDAETITIDSLERHAEEERRKEAAKTEQWYDGEEWYEVYLYNTSGSSRAHYFVRGAGDGDGAVCGSATYSSGIRNNPIKPTCKRCDVVVVRR